MQISGLASVVVLAGLIVGAAEYALLIRRRVHERRINGRLRQLETLLRGWWANREAVGRGPATASRVQTAR
ncbi:MAG: hypothetical protein ABJB65_08850 [Chloroflexota bacterium]